MFCDGKKNEKCEHCYCENCKHSLAEEIFKQRARAKHARDVKFFKDLNFENVEKKLGLKFKE